MDVEVHAREVQTMLGFAEIDRFWPEFKIDSTGLEAEFRDISARSIRLTV